MPENKPGILRRSVSAVGNLFLRWWREATGPLLSDDHPLLVDAILRRLWVLTPVLLLALILLGALGFYLFTGWRARDLTAKALASADAGSWHFARRQIAAAANLRPELPAVKRANAVIESRLGNPEAVAMWEEIGEGAVLTGDEIDARAEVMTLRGDDAQFDLAVDALEAQGETGRAAELRSRRSLRRGDIAQAIAQARAAAASSEEPPLRLRLLQLLAARHGSLLTDRSEAGLDLAAAAEMSALIDGLAGTPSGGEALVIGLEAPYFPAGKKSEWAAAAWLQPTDTNPALLPAAEFLAVSGAESREALYEKLQPVYAGSLPPQRAALARWMLGRGMNEQVLAAVSIADAAQDEALFRQRASALAGLGRWEEAIQLAQTPESKAPESVRLMVQALATGELGRRGEADELARDRFGRQGQFATLDQAYVAARQAAPSAMSVRDYALYLELLAGSGVDPTVTAGVVAEHPADVGARFNHALALLKAGRPGEALAVFDDLDVMVDKLPPGLRAVSAAVLHAAGDPSALVVVRGIDPALLSPGEYALIAPLRFEGQ